MGAYTFIAGMRDHNCVLGNANVDIETLEELREILKGDFEEAYELFGSRWKVDYEDINVDDISCLRGEEEEKSFLTDSDFYEIANEILLEVENQWKLIN
jgi:hypothetical protein